MSAEVIQLIERRRSWPTELKLEILLEALQPGTTIAATADRHGVARGLVYTWMRAARDGRLPGLSRNDKPRTDGPHNDGAPTFVSVRVADKPAPGPMTPAGTAPPCLSRHPVHRRLQAPAQLPEPPRRRPRADWPPAPPGYVVVTLANGRVVKVCESINAGQLARLVAALDGDGLLDGEAP